MSLEKLQIEFNMTVQVHIANDDNLEACHPDCRTIYCTCLIHAWYMYIYSWYNYSFDLPVFCLGLFEWPRMKTFTCTMHCIV